MSRLVCARVLAFVWMLFSSSVIWAGVIPITIRRSVDVQATANAGLGAQTSSGMQSSNTFGTFISEIDRQSYQENAGTGANVLTKADGLHGTSAGPTTLFGLTETTAWLYVDDGGSGGSASGVADGVSELIYSFSLDAPTSYRLDGLLDGFGPTSIAKSEYKLTGPSGVVFNPTNALMVGDEPYIAQSSGVLPTGTYTFEMRSDVYYTNPAYEYVEAVTGGLFELGVNPNYVFNGGFEASFVPKPDEDLSYAVGWETTGDAGPRFFGPDETLPAMLLNPGSTATTIVDTDIDEFSLVFDIMFPQSFSSMEIEIDGERIARIYAPPADVHPLFFERFWKIAIDVSDLALQNLVDVDLTFLFFGQAGSMAWIDNVDLSPDTLNVDAGFVCAGGPDCEFELYNAAFVPEPDTLALLMCGLICLCCGRSFRIDGRASVSAAR